MSKIYKILGLRTVHKSSRHQAGAGGEETIDDESHAQIFPAQTIFYQGGVPFAEIYSNSGKDITPAVSPVEHP